MEKVSKLGYHPLDGESGKEVAECDGATHRPEGDRIDFVFK